MNFTEDSVRELSPDSASAKAGLQLATSEKWLNGYVHKSALWGECKGSGANPYFTQVDLEDIAFKCTCPSRKFPCKHGLALLWLYVKEPTFFREETVLHARVSEWLDKRRGRQDTSVKKADKPVDEEAQLKRARQREQKVEEGLDELELWMKDIIRTGIKNLPSQQYAVFQHIIARMVDAQAGGLARMLQDLSEMSYFEEGWEIRFMRQFSRIFLIIQSYRNRDNLSPEWQQELRSRIGWSIGKDELAQLPAAKSKWLVLNNERRSYDKLISDKTWLFDIHNRCFAYQLQFYMSQQAIFEKILPAGSVVEAEVVYYPGRATQRVWLKETSPILDETYAPSAAPSLLKDIYPQIIQVKAQNPLTEEVPFILSGIRLVNSDGKWFIMDVVNEGIPVRQKERTLLKIWALHATNPINAFVLYKEGALRIACLITAKEGCQATVE